MSGLCNILTSCTHQTVYCVSIVNLNYNIENLTGNLYTIRPFNSLLNFFLVAVLGT